MTCLLRHITKADVDGSEALGFVVGGVVLWGCSMIEAFPCGLASSSEEAAAAVAALAFFLVMLSESNSNICIHMLGLSASRQLRSRLHQSGKFRLRWRLPFQGHSSSNGLGKIGCNDSYDRTSA